MTALKKQFQIKTTAKVLKKFVNSFWIKNMTKFKNEYK